MVFLTRFYSWIREIAALGTRRHAAMTGPVTPAWAGRAPGWTDLIKGLTGEIFWWETASMISPR